MKSKKTKLKVKNNNYVNVIEEKYLNFSFIIFVEYVRIYGFMNSMYKKAIKSRSLNNERGFSYTF
ncbi:hypothetical protein UT300003_05060 [Clostridium sardiniense]